jgi:DNA polymerase III alpha subunit
MTDIDIDLPTTFNPLTYFETAIQASMVKDGQLLKHPCGVYFQTIPVDTITGLAAIPYEESEKLGYFKIDFLHLSILDYFENKEQIRTLLKKDPDWTLLEREDVVVKLFQLHSHFKVISQIKPKSVQELADVIAIIRPKKRHLLNDYLKNKEKIRPQLYRQSTEDKSSFKRGHAISYALTIKLQLLLIGNGIM